MPVQSTDMYAEAVGNQYRDKEEDYFLHARSEVLPLLPAHAARALDVGCGAGQTLALIKQRGYCEWAGGVELSGAAAELARRRLDQVWTGNIEAIDIPVAEGSIDLLLCLDVLEHLVDPWAVLARLAGTLREDGTVVVSLPNVRHYSVWLPLLAAGRWAYRESGILDRTHLRFFTRSTACELVESAGLRVEQVVAKNLHGTHWKYRLLHALTQGRVAPFFEFQYLIRARKVTS
jgi:SAM-dependent methyltransferase